MARDRGGCWPHDQWLAAGRQQPILRAAQDDMFKGLSDCRSRSAATAFEGRLGGDSIGETLELDALLVQRANQIDQVFDAATKSIQFPDNKGIALA